MKKHDFSKSVSEASENVNLFVSLSRLVSFGVCIPLYLYIQYFLDIKRNNIKRWSIKRTSKVQEKNMSCEPVLNFNQWKALSKNYKPIRVWLLLFYKFTNNNNCHSWLFFESIQIQESYPTSLDKIGVLT